jgi:hypothetical protein
MQLLARVLLFIYVPVVAIGIAIGFLDPPTGRGSEGMLGVLAAAVISLPWGVILLVLDDATLNIKDRLDSEVPVMWFMWALAGINTWLLARWGYGTSESGGVLSWLVERKVAVGLVVAIGCIPLAAINVDLALTLASAIGFLFFVAAFWRRR